MGRYWSYSPCQRTLELVPVHACWDRRYSLTFRQSWSSPKKQSGQPLIGAVASPCALHWALVVETHTCEQRRAERCVKLGITQHQVILRWYFCSLTLWSFHMLPSVESTHCTYGIFIHAVRWSWIISSYISSFPSIFRQERKNDFLYNILARVLK